MTSPAISPRESLLAAANELDGAGRASGAVQAAALRDTAAAIEHHLDTLSKELNHGAGRMPARLRPMGREIEAQLRTLLVRCWEAERARRDRHEDIAPLHDLARDLRATASEDLHMVFESFRDTGIAD
jgi:hypothetical protein